MYRYACVNPKSYLAFVCISLSFSSVSRSCSKYSSVGLHRIWVFLLPLMALTHVLFADLSTSHMHLAGQFGYRSVFSRSQTAWLIKESRTIHYTCAEITKSQKHRETSSERTKLEKEASCQNLKIGHSPATDLSQTSRFQNLKLHALIFILVASQQNVPRISRDIFI